MAFYIPGSQAHRVTPVPVGHAPTAPNQDTRFHAGGLAFVARRDSFAFAPASSWQPDSLHGAPTGLPGSLAVHLQLCNVPATPDGPSRLAKAAFPVLPPLSRKRRHHHCEFRGSIALLRCPLCTLHDARCRTPCNTRFRLAGWPVRNAPHKNLWVGPGPSPAFRGAGRSRSGRWPRHRHAWSVGGH